jgi:hypothetical protein
MDKEFYPNIESILIYSVAEAKNFDRVKEAKSRMNYYKTQGLYIGEYSEELFTTTRDMIRKCQQ